MKARYYILCVLALAATACLRDPDAPNNQPDTPTLSVDDASLTRVSMLVEGSFGADMTDITTYGVELSETLFEDGGDPQILVPQELVGGSFSIGVTGLKSNSTYYMRSFIGNGHSKLYSKTLTQKTPESSVASVSDVTLQDGFNLVATIEDDGGREVYDVGFVWGAENDVKKIRREKRVPGTLSADGKSFSMPISEVGAGTYYILAYVEDDKSGTGFSRITYQLSMRDDDEVNIEDPNFKAYLLAHHDRNKDGKISYGELKVIEFVETSTDEIRSVREIEGMPELFRVMLKGSEPRKGKLTAMPVKQNSKLRTLDCSNNNIASLDLSGNKELEYLDCSGNALTALSVANSIRLDGLDVSDNQLTELDLSNNSGLRSLNISGNKFPSQDYSGMIALKELNCRNNPQMDTLYLSINQEFTLLEVGDNTTIKYVDAPEQPNNEVWYTSTDGNVVSINTQTINEWGASLVSNTYQDGKGVISFDGPISAIATSAFRNCETLETVTYISNTVTQINWGGFMSCKNLVSVQLPADLKKIGGYALSYTAISSIDLPETLEFIDHDAFADCLLQEITIPSSVTYISPIRPFGGGTPMKAFYGKGAADDHSCLVFDGTLVGITNKSENLDFVVPDGVKNLGTQTFDFQCYYRSITFPESLEAVGEYGAFSSPQRLQAFYGSHTSSDNRLLILNGVLQGFAHYNLESEIYTIQEPITAIGSYALYNQNNYRLKELVLPETLERIGSNAFSLTGIARLELPSSLKYIENEAFSSAVCLTHITIPASVVSIGSKAFEGAGYQHDGTGDGMTDITFLSSTPPSISSDTFDNMVSDCPLYVPAEAVDAYKSATNWSRYASRIQAMPSEITASKYLTFTSTGTTGINLFNQGNNAPVLYYSYDLETWTQWDYTDLTFSQGSPLYICGDNPQGISFSEEKYSNFRYVSLNDSPYTVSGDVMALINKDEDVSVIPSDYCFYTLFMDNPGLTAAPSLPATTLTKHCYELMFDHTGLTAAPALPATTMAEACYMRMFTRCASLTAAPALPATTLAKSCYERMFFECNALVSAPALPATTLAPYCYSEMFMNSNGIMDAPELPAPVLVEGCYSGMFAGCENLSYVRCYATDISALNCTDDWLYYVASSGSFVKAAANNSWTRGDDGIPEGWEVFNDDGSAPVSVAKYLTFTSEGTTKISVSNIGNSAPVLYYSNDLESWYDWDYSELTFAQGKPLYICGDNPDGFSLSLSENSRFVTSGDLFSVSGSVMSLLEMNSDLYVIPKDACFCYLFDSCTNLKVAPELPATTLTELCYMCMFHGCTSLIATPQLPATTMKNLCYSDMFAGCTSLTSVTTLPATTLDSGCYHHLFTDCTSLVSAPELPATTMTVSCYSGMFYGCTSLTTAPDLPATVLAEDCYQMMFYGCTGLTSAPTLPAATLVTTCYQQMFVGCSNLRYVKCLATDISATDCLTNWLVRVASTGTFVKAPNAQWTTGVSGIPNGWATVNDGDAPSGGNEGTSEEDWN